MASKNEIRNLWILSVGLCFVTLFVYTVNISDPVNAPKFLLAGVISFVAFALLVLPKIRVIYLEFRIAFWISILMVFFMFLSSLKSMSPFSQNIYGVQGRNTGLLNHISLLLILLAMLGVRNSENFRIPFFGMIIAGACNVVYSLWVLAFGDFIPWSNPYKSLLGTLGNPNFISSFLGISTCGFYGYIFAKRTSVRNKVTTLLLLPVILFEIWKTNSIQGFAVVAIGSYLIFFMYLYVIVKKRVITIFYTGLGGLISILGVYGFANRGPLASILYQETLAFRWQYSLAGLNMGMKFPITGVGLDSYGDWYRQLRTAKSVVSPGVEVITNVAHNVYVDAFANGGAPLLLAYFTFSALALKSIFFILRTSTSLDPVFVGISVSWLAYQAQSLISISQIGLTVWGWALSGMLIAYPKRALITPVSSAPGLKKSLQNQEVESLLMPMTVVSATVLSLVLYAPPILADHKWTVAYSHRNADELLQSLEPSYFNPSNSFTYAQAIQLFENSNLNEQAHQLALRATRFNPINFDAWQMLYSIKNSTMTERAQALEMMIKLDPRNIELRKLKN